MFIIWSLLFFDVERRNDVLIKFKGNWRNKFGHIKRLKNKNSEIAINGFFKKEIVPEYIVDVTIAHELVHYMHGFNSPHPKLFAHPHKGGVVDKELRGRGFGQNLLMGLFIFCIFSEIRADEQVSLWLLLDYTLFRCKV